MGILECRNNCSIEVGSVGRINGRTEESLAIEDKVHALRIDVNGEGARTGKRQHRE